jgi:hypothetical protein
MQIGIAARRSVDQGVSLLIREPNKIGASTVYDFEVHNLTAHGGLLPVATTLEKLAFQGLIEETLTIKRRTRSMPPTLRLSTCFSSGPCKTKAKNC